MKVFVLCALAVTATANASVDLSGAYDLGLHAAAMVLRKDVNEVGEEIGILSFCRRQTLIEEKRCTGAALPIRCKTSDSVWTCEERGHYPFFGEITRVSDNKIHYKFKSSFNEGDLEGTRLPIVLDEGS